jgi:glutamyl-tRNA reductase
MASVSLARVVGTDPAPRGAAATARRVPPVPRTLIVAGFELSLATTSLEELERAAEALDRGWLAERFDRFRGTEEAALVATCCRRELALLVRSPQELDRWRRALPGPPAAWRERQGRESVGHWLRVAGGRESIAVGEREVRGQVRAAGRATLSRHRARVLRDLLEGAVDVAERASPSVPPARSIAALAATRVLDLCGRPFPRVLVVGAGAVGRQVTQLLAPSCRISVAYRERLPDEAFLRATGARAVRASALAPEIALTDAVVTAAAGGVRCLGPSDLPAGRSIVLVDLGMPRNVDPAAGRLPGVRLVDLAELRAGARRDPEEPDDAGAEGAVDQLLGRVTAETSEPWVAAVRRHAEELRRDELRVGRRFLGPLTPEQEFALDRMTRRLVDRLLRGPTERLRDLPPGSEGDRLRRFALELWPGEPPRS